MINPNNLQELSDELEKVLETPVSKKILLKLSDKQKKYLTHLINEALSLRNFIQSINNDNSLLKEEKEKSINEYKKVNKSISIIKNILDYGKSKIKKEHRLQAPLY